MDIRPNALTVARAALAACLVFLAAAAHADPSDWTHVTVEDPDPDGGAEHSGTFASLALDADGNRHISYRYKYDPNVRAWDRDLRYAFSSDGTTWQTETADAVGWAGDFSSIALDSAGNPHISYYEGLNSDLMYASKSTSGWTTSFADGNWSGEYHKTGRYGSLAIDAAGKAHIAYNWVDRGDLMYATSSDGTTWSTGKADDLSVNAWTSIALDANAGRHVSYNQGDQSGSRLKYAYSPDGSSWTTTTVDDSGNYVGSYTSLALDASGRPHISYYDQDNDALKYAYLSESNVWIPATVDSIPNGDVGEWTSLALDANGNPHISYYTRRVKIGVDEANLRYAYWNGSTWVIDTVDQQGSVGEYSSLALDAYGNPHISYYDATNGALKYATKGDAAVIPEPLSMAFMGSAFVGVVAWRARRRRKRMRDS